MSNRYDPHDPCGLCQADDIISCKVCHCHALRQPQEVAFGGADRSPNARPKAEIPADHGRSASLKTAAAA